MALGRTITLDRLHAQFIALRREFREFARRVVRSVITPRRFQRQIEAATRPGQILALLLVAPLVVVSLQLIVAFNQVMTGVLETGYTSETQQVDIVEWLVTAITISVFALAAYTWFMFVRTAGFGWFIWRE